MYQISFPFCQFLFSTVELLSMSKNILSYIAGKIITFSFYILFFFIPLAFTPFTFELFEYNKMMAAYALTVIIIGSWLIKMVAEKEFKITRTPFDIPLLLFTGSQIISTIISIDPHVSWWGYYSRFNGGLISIITYIFLYYAFVSNIKKENIKKYILTAMSAGLLISIYGILEHLGIDKSFWIQDVQNRVFSSLGQPNWLAAYLAVLLPVAIGSSLNAITSPKSDFEDKNQSVSLQTKFKNIFSLPFLIYFILSIVFYTTLIFTNSRSGMGGFWIASGVFWLFVFLLYKISVIKLFLIFNLSFLFLNFIFGTPFVQINRFTLPEIIRSTSQTSPPKTINSQPSTNNSLLESGVTDSGDIRKIVWKGALDIIASHPLFGTGTETFAFAYYKYRPVEHNMTSEWDFLYNKAHNEYLNYAATTGLVGLGTYLLFIGTVIFWSLNKIKAQSASWRTNLKTKTKNLQSKKFDILDVDLTFDILHLSLFSAWLSILITNFLGFSVVIVQIFFFLIPAILTILNEQAGDAKEGLPRNVSLAERVLRLWSKKTSFRDGLETFLGKPERPDPQIKINISNTISIKQSIFIIIILLLSLYLLSKLFFMYWADTYYATGYRDSRAGSYIDAYEQLKEAISLNPDEVLYYDEFSLPAAALSVGASQQKETTLSARLKTQAVAASNYAIANSPNNVNFYKTRSRVFYTLSKIDPSYINQAINALKEASTLSPTDPKINYNLGLMYGQAGDNQKAIQYLKQSADLKPNYREAFLGLSLYYKEIGDKQNSRKYAQYVLEKINPGDSDAQAILDQISK